MLVKSVGAEIWDPFSKMLGYRRMFYHGVLLARGWKLQNCENRFFYKLAYKHNL